MRGFTPIRKGESFQNRVAGGKVALHTHQPPLCMNLTRQPGTCGHQVPHGTQGLVPLKVSVAEPLTASPFSPLILCRGQAARLPLARGGPCEVGGGLAHRPPSHLSVECPPVRCQSASPVQLLAANKIGPGRVKRGGGNERGRGGEGSEGGQKTSPRHRSLLHFLPTAIARNWGVALARKGMQRRRRIRTYSSEGAASLGISR